MTSIFWDVIEGGENGERVAESANTSINKFFVFGIKNIEKECNKVSNKYRVIWSLRQPTDLMSEYNLPITYEAGCKELVPHFELSEPITIRVKILDSYHPENPDCPATTGHLDAKNSILTIYLKALEVGNSGIIEKKSGNSLASIINHELLHACGDSPILREEIHDGVLRHSMVPEEAINNLSTTR